MRPRHLRRRRATRLTACCASLLAGSILAGCGAPWRGEPLGPRPIIILDVDTLRASHLGCYGYPRDTSPTIDRLAAESLLFEWAFGHGPYTPPAQASIFTSLYPSSHGLVESSDRLAEDVTTLAEVLRANGYTTAGFVDGAYLNPEFGFAQGFDLYDSHDPLGLSFIAPRVVSWLKQRQDEEPFFLLVHTYDVHAPYWPPQPFRSTFLDTVAPPTPGFLPTLEVLEAIRQSRWTGQERTLPDNDLAYVKALYDASIRYTDHWIGALMQNFEQLGLLERAIIVLISDHGEEFQEHGSLLHEKLYATITRIPLLIRLPGGVGARRLPQVVEAIDLMPTLLELVGIPEPPGLQGRSLLPLLRGEDLGARVAIGESRFFGGQHHLANDRFHLLHFEETDEVELYDVRSDPDEQFDLSRRQPLVTARLRRALEAWRQMQRERPAPRAAAEIDPETRKQLQALGYLE